MPQMAEAIGSKELAGVKVDDIAFGAAVPLHPGAERYLKEYKKSK
jgi:TRAP-type uncharacterized transport system substrate-binding protein